MRFPEKKEVAEKVEESIFYLENIPPLNLIPLVYHGAKIVYYKLRE